MFCQYCGGELVEGVRFCPRCGKAIMPAVPAHAGGRIAEHVQLLGILWLAIGAFRLIPALILVGLSLAPILPPGVPQFVRGIFPAIGALLLVWALISIVTGGGLLARKSWGRMLAIVFGGLNLVDIPFGTALGVYTLRVMLGEQSEQEYRQVVGAVG